MTVVELIEQLRSDDDPQRRKEVVAAIRTELLRQMKAEIINEADLLIDRLNRLGHDLRHFPTDDRDVDYYDWRWEHDPAGGNVGLRISVGIDAEVQVDGVRSAFDTQ